MKALSLWQPWASGIFAGVKSIETRHWRPPEALIGELLAAGVRATVVAVDAAKLDASFLGRELTPDLVAELEAAGADACGEEGEYHTMVTAAPLFSTPVPLAWDGREERDGHWVLKFSVGDAT